jgi:diguanylate cyclase (GGDEF)-like protein/PAS domain S-box-containing protein
MSIFHDFEICRDILESLPAGLCVLDLQKKVVFWSEGAERITGRLRHEVIGKSCIAEPFLYCDQPGCEFCREDCPLSKAIKTSRPADAVGFLHHKDGHEVSVRARAIPVRNAHGSVIGVAAIFENRHEDETSDHPEEGRCLPGCVDEVTGLSNRDMMYPLLRETLAMFAEMHVPFSLLMFRVERLDQFRASFGPEAASALLRIIARTLEGALWRSDFVGRWSDDHFLVVLNGCRDQPLYSVRERLRRTLSADSIEWWGERRSLPLSIGQATVEPGDTVESLLERAHKAIDMPSAQDTAAATFTNPFTRS